MKSQEEITQLLEKYKQGLCTLEEQAIVESWYNLKVAQNSEIKITDDLAMAKSLIWEKLDKILPAVKIPFYQQLYFRVGVAAAVIGVVLFTALFFYTNEQKTNPATIVAQYDILPGTTGATLTLANGKKIVLAGVSTGEIAKEEGVNISKTDSGKLLYTLERSTLSSNQPNTLSTAKGQTYDLVLPDGSKVTLNAASSLTYSATLMESGVRRVKLSGEAYFQIAKDKRHPFIVESKGQEVEVLGTHFNISAYADEQKLKTTLAEGSIRIKAAGMSKILKPNEQAIVDSRGLVVNEVDPEFALAWKNGFFIFDSEDLESVMAKIARWYNVEVIYDDPSLKIETILGTMSRYDKISKVLKVLERTKVAEFELDGKVVRVRKKK